jgi:hypothetical protein
LIAIFVVIAAVAIPLMIVEQRALRRRVERISRKTDELFFDEPLNHPQAPDRTEKGSSGNEKTARL